MNYQLDGNFRLNEIYFALTLVGIERFIKKQVIVKEYAEKVYKQVGFLLKDPAQNHQKFKHHYLMHIRV